MDEEKQKQALIKKIRKYEKEMELLQQLVVHLNNNGFRISQQDMQFIRCKLEQYVNFDDPNAATTTEFMRQYPIETRGAPLVCEQPNGSVGLATEIKTFVLKGGRRKLKR